MAIRATQYTKHSQHLQFAQQADGGNSHQDGYTARDMERWVPEPPKSQERTAFERDRARLIHASSLRRLGAKTQILVAGTDDFSRTRLTHTLEVAQIGRQIGAMLGCDPDVVDCACLAHDLGHPPFGHNGERALASFAKEIGGFEGNAQTLRILTRLEPKVFNAQGQCVGVNLTRASLDAAVKYPWTWQDAPTNPDGSKSNKFCVYPDDEPVFTWLKQGAPARTKPMEAQVMDLADDIAYSVHDVEDAIVAGSCDPALLASSATLDAIITETQQWYGDTWQPELLVQAFERLRAEALLPTAFDGSRRALAQLKNATSALIGRFAIAVERATRQAHGQGNLTRYSAHVVTPQETSYEIMALKGIAVHFVMQPRSLMQSHRDQQHTISSCVQMLMEGASIVGGSKLDPSPALDPVFIEDWHRATNDHERLRVAIDQVASLTDGSVVSMENHYVRQLAHTLR